MEMIVVARITTVAETITYTCPFLSVNQDLNPIYKPSKTQD